MTHYPNPYQQPPHGYAPQAHGYGARPPGYGPPGYYAPYGGQYATPYAGYGEPDKHSGVGIASFVLSLLCGVGEVVLVVIAVAMEANTPGVFDQESPEAAVLGLLVLLGLVLALAGVGLGVGGLLQPRRKRVFAVLGLVFNGLIVLLLAVLFVLGEAAG